MIKLLCLTFNLWKIDTIINLDLDLDCRVCPTSTRSLYYYINFRKSWKLIAIRKIHFTISTWEKNISP